MLIVTQRAAQEMRAILAANSTDASHVLRIDTECDGFSVWLGPEMEGDCLMGSEDTLLVRVSPELSVFLGEVSVIIDCMESPDGPRLVVYREDEPQLQATPPKPRRRPSTSRKTKQQRPKPHD
ncbi:MAG: hypothetical protein A2Y72_04505 [Chloroflexi bacterium RBG_13_53_26]|nr:MAG: hypothetical protein A2Y72_04505 [Chloroflexi bacterium RBG_13_53_26]